MLLLFSGFNAILGTLKYTHCAYTFLFSVIASKIRTKRSYDLEEQKMYLNVECLKNIPYQLFNFEKFQTSKKVKEKYNEYPHIFHLDSTIATVLPYLPSISSLLEIPKPFEINM